MKITRREICALFPFTMIASSWAASQPPAGAASAPVLRSGVFQFKDLKLQARPGGEFRSILRGATPTGEQIEAHETMLQPGTAPHAPHHHAHSEFWLVREGTLEVTINGKAYQIGPGSVAFAASNDEHGVRNIGTTPVSYFVVAIGK